MIRAVISTPAALFRACGTLLHHRSLQYLYLRPYLFGFTLFLSLITGSYIYREQVAGLISNEPGFIAVSVVLVSAVLSASLIAFLALLVTSELLLDSFLLKAFSLKGVEKHSSSTPLVREVATSTIAICVRLCIIACLFVCTLSSFVFPPVAPIAWSLNVLYLGGELFISPLTALNLPYRRQLRLLRNHKSEVVMMGLLFTALLIIPFAGLFILPLAYLTAIEKISRWPDLPR